MLKNLLYISISITFVIISWIGFSVLHNVSTSTISPDTNIRIIPITPSFDTNTINMLKSRNNVSADLNEKIKAATTTPTIITPKVSTNTTSTDEENNNASSPADLNSVEN